MYKHLSKSARQTWQVQNMLWQRLHGVQTNNYIYIYSGEVTRMLALETLKKKVVYVLNEKKVAQIRTLLPDMMLQFSLFCFLNSRYRPLLDHVAQTAHLSSKTKEHQQF